MVMHHLPRLHGGLPGLHRARAQDHRYAPLPRHAGEPLPPELARLFRNLEQKGNPWEFSPNARADWAEALNVPILADMAAQAESEGRPLFAGPAIKTEVEREAVSHGDPNFQVEASAPPPQSLTPNPQPLL